MIDQTTNDLREFLKIKNIIGFIKFLRFNDIAILRSISGSSNFATH